MFRFASPYFLLLLVALPATLWIRRRSGGLPEMAMPGLAGVSGLRPSLWLRAGRMLPALKYAALCLMVTALARPQWGTERMNVLTEGVNIILAVDLSESMAALDFKQNGRMVNRLEAVKGVVAEFVRKRSGDRIGLVVFGSQAYTQIPLTRDDATIVSVLERLEIGAAGKNTAIGDAIGISLKRIGDIESASNIIILLTDGRSNTGELPPEIAAGIAAEKGIRIYTVGVGSRGEAPFPVQDPFFGERYVYQRVDIDEETLQAIAGKTGGAYFRAEDTAGLAAVYDAIDRMEKTEVQVERFAEHRDLYPYFLVPCVVLLMLWGILTNTRLLRVP